MEQIDELHVTRTAFRDEVPDADLAHASRVLSMGTVSNLQAIHLQRF